MPFSPIIMSLVLDFMVAGLLGATIFYCVKLNRRIRVLQDSKSELAELIRQFDESTQQATHSISEIHRASKKINENMQARLDKANYLADDLAFMIEKANKLADRMDGQIGTTRTALGEKPAGGGGSRSRAAASAAAVEDAPAREPALTRAAPDAPATREPRGSKGIEALKARAEELKNGDAPTEPAGRQRRVGARMRSKAEQELYDALKNPRS